MEKKVYRITYLKIKDKRSFFEFRKQLKKQRKQLLPDLNFALFESFFSFPKKNAVNAFVEIMEWKNMSEYEKSKIHLDRISLNLNESDFLEIEEDFILETEKGEAFSIVNLKEENLVVEFASRTIKEKKKKIFSAKKEEFLSFFRKQQGYYIDQEFKEITKDINVLFFVWKSQTDFENAGNKVKKSLKLIFKVFKYFSLIKQKAFQVGKYLRE
ncbi:hypothetical protein [Aureivirga sp. CE67]|uniref:hypothetical protein n=1 Tax=Aureivirga sp. CE67 TaxID=1788983 RepID=UPI0018CA309C|nr:hypothetical protein [Aureivirga sp. CE67]